MGWGPNSWRQESWRSGEELFPESALSERAVSDLNPTPSDQRSPAKCRLPPNLCPAPLPPHQRSPWPLFRAGRFSRWFLYRNPEALKQGGRPWLYEPRLGGRKLPSEGPWVCGWFLDPTGRAKGLRLDKRAGADGESAQTHGLWPSTKVEGCVFGLGGLIGQGLAPHQPLLLKLGAGGRSQTECTAGRPQESKVPREEVDSCILFIPSGSLSGEQQAAVFNPRRNCPWSRGQLSRWPVGMRGVVSASKQVGVAPILSCKCTGCVTPGLVAWADHPPHPGPLDLLHPALGLLQNEMEVGRLLAPSSHHSPAPMDILVHAWVAREVCPFET